MTAPSVSTIVPPLKAPMTPGSSSRLAIQSMPLGGQALIRLTAIPAALARPTAEMTPSERLLSWRSEEHTSELQSLMRISYAVFCLKKKTTNKQELRPYYKRQKTKKYT